MTKLFNQRALKSHRRVGDQNGPITLLTPPLKLTLMLGVLIAAGVGIWAFVARIPITVRGTGVLLPVSTINRTLSRSNGTAHWMFTRQPADWHGDAMQHLLQPNQLTDEQVRRLSADVLQAGQDIFQSSQDSGENGAFSSTAEEFTDSMKDVFYGRRIKPGTLMLWVRSVPNQERLQSALDRLQITLRDNKIQEQNITNKQHILQKELASSQAYLQQMLQLKAKGFVSTESILQEQAKVEKIRSRILDNRNALVRLKNEIDKENQKLRDELTFVLDKELIFAKREVYLSQVVPNDGETVAEGHSVLQLSSDDLNAITLVPLFLSSKEMAQVFPGMPAIATPVGYKRSEVGGIVSEVVSMAKIPSSKDHVIARTGVESLADMIMNREPSPTLAVLKLKQTKGTSALNTGGYEWSTGGDLPFPPTPGDRLDVEITTRKMTPIQLVLPAMRRFFGITPPNSLDGMADESETPTT